MMMNEWGTGGNKVGRLRRGRVSDCVELLWASTITSEMVRDQMHKRAGKTSLGNMHIYFESFRISNQYSHCLNLSASPFCLVLKLIWRVAFLQEKKVWTLPYPYRILTLSLPYPYSIPTVTPTVTLLPCRTLQRPSLRARRVPLSE